MTHVFNWQAEPDGTLKWLIPTVLDTRDEAQFERVRQLSENFTKIELSILVNGVEVNADAFVRSLTRNLEHLTKTEARRILDDFDVDGEFRRVEHMMRDLTAALRRDLESRLAQLGFDLRNYDPD